MSKTTITKQVAAERIGDLLKELQWFDKAAMVSGLERLKFELEEDDPDWSSTWDDTILGCSPWSIGDMERAISLFNDLAYVQVETDEETA
jgi:hypothetical protein